MNPTQLRDVMELLQRAGYLFPEDRMCTTGNICLRDPTCIWPPLLEFIDTAWVVLIIITGFLLAGWGITMVRGANHDMIKNLRSLVLIFGTLSAAIPAMNVLGVGKAIVSTCETIEISQAEVAELLKLHENEMENPTYEHFEVLDSAFDDVQL